MLQNFTEGLANWDLKQQNQSHTFPKVKRLTYQLKRQMSEQLNYSVNLISTIPEVGSGETEYKAANCVVALRKGHIKSVTLGKGLKDKHTCTAKQGAKNLCKVPHRTLLSWPQNGQGGSMAEDRVMRCGWKRPSL